MSYNPRKSFFTFRYIVMRINNLYENKSCIEFHPYKDIVLYTFLFFFGLTVFISLNYSFIAELRYLGNLQSILKQRTILLNTLTIFWGLVAFWSAKTQLKNPVENETIIKEVDNELRKACAAEKHHRYKWIPFGYSLVRWVEKDGWGYFSCLLGLFALFFFTRLYDTNFINGSDNYNILGIKNYFENEISFYKYHPITDFFMLWSVRVFGFNFFSIKVPFIIYSFITLIFIYLTARIKDKWLALMATCLYVISPWAIIQARITRDYSFDLMVCSIAIYASYVLYYRIKATEDTYQLLKLFFCYLMIPVSIYFLAEYNRIQTLIAGVYIVIFLLFMLWQLYKRMFMNKNVVLISQLISLVVLITIIYFSKLHSFVRGFNAPDLIFFRIYFDPLIASPWHWFHNNNISFYLILGLFMAGLSICGYKSEQSDYFGIMFGSFVLGLVLYVVKYDSHLNYIPVRYIYFLLLPFIIILSSALLNIIQIFKNRLQKVIVILFFAMIINPIALIYASNPIAAYEREGITNPQIDNIGIGRFEMLDVIDFVENELDITDETVLVLSGRYEEFVLHLNRPMDPERFLDRPWGGKYDIAKNTYVQSNYFGYSELLSALSNYQEGFYITDENEVYNAEKELLFDLSGKEDILLAEGELRFIEEVNNFKIYHWRK